MALPKVLGKLADGLYHQRRGADLLAGKLVPELRVDAGGGRRWWLPNISSLSRARAKPARLLHPRPPGPGQPAENRKAGDFPARKPGEPSVTAVTRRIEFHLLYLWQVT